MKKLLSTKEASKITGYSNAHIRRLANWGKIKSTRISPHSAIKFQLQDLLNLTQAPHLYPKIKDPKK